MTRKRLNVPIAIGFKIFLAFATTIGSIFALVVGCCIAIIAILIGIVIVMASPPLFRLDSDLFSPPSRELVEALTPYLDSWLSKSAEQTQVEREEIGLRNRVRIFIDNGTDELSGETFPIVNILAENVYTWQRGYLYTDRPVDLREAHISSFYGNLEIRQVNEHWFIYNHSAD